MRITRNTPAAEGQALALKSIKRFYVNAKRRKSTGTAAILVKLFAPPVKHIEVNEAFAAVISVELSPVRILPECPVPVFAEAGLEINVAYPYIVSLKSAFNIRLVSSLGNVNDGFHLIMRLKRLKHCGQFALDINPFGRRAEEFAVKLKVNTGGSMLS